MVLHDPLGARSKNTIVHANITDRKKFWGMNFGKDYSMITDLNVSRSIFAKITESLARKSVKFVSQSVIITEEILR